MTHVLHGTIEKALPDGRSVPMSDATIRVYRVSEEVSPDEIAARPKETFAIVDSQEIEDRFTRLGTASLDDQGGYEVRLDEDKAYEGGPIAIHLHMDRVPATNDPEPIQAALDLVQPRWRTVTEEEDKDNAAFLTRRRVKEAQGVENWDHVISSQHWCAILEAFGVWVVCGQVTLCPPETDQGEETTGGTSTKPVSGVTVSAKDRDILQDDALGSDVTDANGHYCIYYRKRPFEETPSPWGPIELIGGPDLYFEITAGGQTVLDEDQQKGRTPGRENAERCEHIDLCVPRGDIPEDGDGSGITRVPTYWRSVGSQFEVPKQAGTIVNSDFDDYGYAGDDKFALYRTITMEGSAPILYATDPDQFVEYRFLVSESPTSNTGNASPQNFQPVGVGSIRFRDAFADGVTVGEILVYDQTAVGDPTDPTVKAVTVNLRGGRGGHQNSAGWVSLKAAADEALNDRLGIDLATVRASGTNYDYLGWDSRNALFGIDTREFTTEPDVGSGSGGTPPAAGDSVSSQQEIDPERIAIRFEARTVDSTGTQVSPAGTGRKLNSGTTLNAAVINNNSAFARFQVDGLASDPCADLTGDVDISYTIHHPHLHGVELHIEKNSQAETFDDPTNEVSFAPGSPPGGNWDDSVVKNSPGDPQTVESLANMGQSIQNAIGADPDASSILNEDCAYRAVFRYKRRLHNGYNADHWNHQDRLFCWAPGGT